MGSITNNKLSRYTTLPVLIDLLKRKKLVLLSPEKWEDKNDAEVMIQYKKKMGLKHLYAACFSEGYETIHHWSAFSSGSSGCCIEFDKKEILSVAKKIDGIRFGSVKYKRLKALQAETIKISDMPFTKRWPYRCEEEFRVIFESKTVMRPYGYFDIDIELKMIRKITISQKMPDQVYETIKEYLKEGFNNPDKKIYRSTLYENKIWISKFKKT